MFFYVYILKSKEHDRYYVGLTSDLRRRLREHNEKRSYWTKRYAPWQIIYFEGYRAEEDAKSREHQLKRFAQAFSQLKRRLVHTLQLSR